MSELPMPASAPDAISRYSTSSIDSPSLSPSLLSPQSNDFFFSADPPTVYIADGRAVQADNLSRNSTEKSSYLSRPDDTFRAAGVLLPLSPTTSEVDYELQLISAKEHEVLLDAYTTLQLVIRCEEHEERRGLVRLFGQRTPRSCRREDVALQTECVPRERNVRGVGTPCRNEPSALHAAMCASAIQSTSQQCHTVSENASAEHGELSVRALRHFFWPLQWVERARWTHSDRRDAICPRDGCMSATAVSIDRHRNTRRNEHHGNDDTIVVSDEDGTEKDTRNDCVDHYTTNNNTNDDDHRNDNKKVDDNSMANAVNEDACETHASSMKVSGTSTQGNTFTAHTTATTIATTAATLASTTTAHMLADAVVSPQLHTDAPCRVQEVRDKAQVTHTTCDDAVEDGDAICALWPCHIRSFDLQRGSWEGKDEYAHNVFHDSTCMPDSPSFPKSANSPRNMNNLDTYCDACNNNNNNNDNVIPSAIALGTSKPKHTHHSDTRMTQPQNHPPCSPSHPLCSGHGCGMPASSVTRVRQLRQGWIDLAAQQHLCTLLVFFFTAALWSGAWLSALDPSVVAAAVEVSGAMGAMASFAAAPVGRVCLSQWLARWSRWRKRARHAGTHEHYYSDDDTDNNIGNGGEGHGQGKHSNDHHGIDGCSPTSMTYTSHLDQVQSTHLHHVGHTGGDGEDNSSHHDSDDAMVRICGVDSQCESHDKEGTADSQRGLLVSPLCAMVGATAASCWPWWGGCVYGLALSVGLSAGAAMLREVWGSGAGVMIQTHSAMLSLCVTGLILSVLSSSSSTRVHNSNADGNGFSHMETATTPSSSFIAGVALALLSGLACGVLLLSRQSSWQVRSKTNSDNSADSAPVEKVRLHQNDDDENAAYNAAIWSVLNRVTARFLWRVAAVSCLSASAMLLVLYHAVLFPSLPAMSSKTEPQQQQQQATNHLSSRWNLLQKLWYRWLQPQEQRIFVAGVIPLHFHGGVALFMTVLLMWPWRGSSAGAARLGHVAVTRVALLLFLLLTVIGIATVLDTSSRDVSKGTSDLWGWGVCTGVLLGAVWALYANSLLRSIAVVAASVQVCATESSGLPRRNGEKRVASHNAPTHARPAQYGAPCGLSHGSAIDESTYLLHRSDNRNYDNTDDANRSHGNSSSNDNSTVISDTNRGGGAGPHGNNGQAGRNVCSCDQTRHPVRTRLSTAPYEACVKVVPSPSHSAMQLHGQHNYTNKTVAREALSCQNLWVQPEGDYTAVALMTGVVAACVTVCAAVMFLTALLLSNVVGDSRWWWWWCNREGQTYGSIAVQQAQTQLAGVFWGLVGLTMMCELVGLSVQRHEYRPFLIAVHVN